MPILLRIDPDKIDKIKTELEELAEERNSGISARELIELLRPDIKRKAEQGHSVRKLLSIVSERTGFKPATLRGYYYGGIEKEPAPAAAPERVRALAPKRRRRVS